MLRTESFDLRGQLPTDEGVEFVSIEIAIEPQLPLAIVLYEHNGWAAPGVRLDLHKRVFIDHPDDPLANRVLERSAESILSWTSQRLAQRAAMHRGSVLWRAEAAGS